MSKKHTREPRFLYNLKGIVRHITPRILSQNLLESKIKHIFKTYDKKLDVLKFRLDFYNKLHSHFELPFSSDEVENGYDFSEFVKRRDCIESKDSKQNMESSADFKADSIDSKTSQNTESKTEFIESKNTIPALPPPHSRLNGLKVIKPDFGLLGQNSLKHGSVYYYDSYQYSRYFADNLRWCYLFGDVDSLLSMPTIVKSRPVIAGNDNSVLLQLEKHRHFHFIHDKRRYENKKNILLFRGAVHQGHRLAFFHKHFKNPLCDIGHVGNNSPHNAAFAKPSMSIEEQLDYKFLLSLEGYDVASNLKWVLSSNSLCVMARPQIETWFMESFLRGGVHYAEISLDFSDLDSVIEYYLRHESEAKEIIENAHRFCAKFFDSNLESALNFLVLRKYFYLSNQINVSNIEREMYEG